MRAPAIYASTATIARQFRNLRDLLTAVTATGGVDGIELGWSPSLEGVAIPQELTKFDVHWLVHNYFPAPAEPFVLNLAATDAALLQRSRSFAAAAIRLSAKLGAPFYSVHCGFLANLDTDSLGRKLHYGELCDYETGYSTFVESLQYLLGEVRAAGIRLLIEPNVVAPFNLIAGRNQLLMMAEPAEFKRLLAEISDERLGVLVDLGHLKVSATTLGFAPEDFVAAVADAVGAFHLHDNDGTADQHRPVAPDSWTFNVIRQSRFRDLPIVVEATFESAVSLAEHCIWLKKQLDC